MKVLHVAASPRARSRSQRLAEQFLEALGSKEVTRLDLWNSPLPDLGGDVMEGRYRLIQGEPVSADVREQWSEIRTVADQAMAHDLWLISTPTWNFGIPYRLKHWIDCIVHPGMTFTNDASGTVTGLAAGRTAVIIAAGALDFADAEQQAALDFQMRYLSTIFQFIGIRDVHTVRAAPTFGPFNLVEAAEARAGKKLRDLARQLSGRGDVPS